MVGSYKNINIHKGYDRCQGSHPLVHVLLAGRVRIDESEGVKQFRQGIVEFSEDVPDASLHGRLQMRKSPELMLSKSNQMTNLNHLFAFIG